ncbi:RNA polymerase sigma-70 factor [Rapidithrix thailandica]|uniref:RNA polymerase sigma-70 factor n=2 Tax=Rapidithrix thailandica TaxID=413964 RepID=A0AAW9RX33_9BACT
MDDISLFKALQQNDERAFKLLYNRYWETIYYLALHKTQSPTDAEDLTHEVFLDLWKNRKKTTIQSSFAAYITTAVKYKVFRWIDAKSVRRKHARHLKKTAPLEYNPVEQQLTFKELYQQIEQNIDKLPEKCRLVFRLSREQNYTAKEIAQQLNVSPNTAQNHINKALKILRLELKEFLLLVFFLSYWIGK